MNEKAIAERVIPLLSSLPAAKAKQVVKRIKGKDLTYGERKRIVDEVMGKNETRMKGVISCRSR